jgi:hypothetical protein
MTQDTIVDEVRRDREEHAAAAVLAQREAARVGLAGMLKPVLDRTTLLHRVGRRGRYPNTRGFVVDAMLALVYPEPKLLEPKEIGHDPSRSRAVVIRGGRFADST